jgi:dihydrodipicolinate synthase/N-acetylneuraminate lyase
MGRIWRMSLRFWFRMEMVFTCGKKGLVFTAFDEMLYSALDLGVAGAIGASLTLFSEIMVKMWNAVQHAKALQAKIYPAWSAIKGTQFQHRLKEAMKQLGRPVGIVASPRSAASPAEQETIRKALQQFKQLID